MVGWLNAPRSAAQWAANFCNAAPIPACRNQETTSRSTNRTARGGGQTGRQRGATTDDRILRQLKARVTCPRERVRSSPPRPVRLPQRGRATQSNSSRTLSFGTSSKKRAGPPRRSRNRPTQLPQGHSVCHPGCGGAGGARQGCLRIDFPASHALALCGSPLHAHGLRRNTRIRVSAAG